MPGVMGQKDWDEHLRKPEEPIKAIEYRILSEYGRSYTFKLSDIVEAQPTKQQGIRTEDE